MENEKKYNYFQFYYISNSGELCDCSKIIVTDANEKTLVRLEKLLIDSINLKPVDRVDKFVKILKELGYYCEEIFCNKICVSTGN